jgi:uncharacterized heparinase superfamily protein
MPVIMIDIPHETIQLDNGSIVAGTSFDLRIQQDGTVLLERKRSLDELFIDHSSYSRTTGIQPEANLTVDGTMLQGQMSAITIDNTGLRINGTTTAATASHVHPLGYAPIMSDGVTVGIRPGQPDRNGRMYTAEVIRSMFESQSK